MKALTYALLAATLFWCDMAYRIATKPAPLIARVPIQTQHASYIVPVHECSRICRAKARSSLTGIRQ